ncbi:hypothetical protein [Peptoniphilus sp.]
MLEAKALFSTTSIAGGLFMLKRTKILEKNFYSPAKINLFIFSL